LDHFVPVDWPTFGVDLYLEIGTAPGRRAALERALRDAIRSRRLQPLTRLPSTRSLAGALGLARGTVNAAYDQLITEGYLSARKGSGTVVVGLPAASTATARSAPEDERPRYDLRPGTPDVTSFPTSAWVRSLRRALAATPASIYGYGDPRGRIELRRALAEYLGRARGVNTEPDRIVIVSGYVQALALLASVFRSAIGGTAIAMENPGLGFHRDVVQRHGIDVVPLPVDDRGARTDLLSTKAFNDVRAAVVTPAHQYPIGVTMRPDRRHAATAWAVACNGFVVEDDYDGEFRYDRQPVGALQGMAPDRVVYIGTASKTLAPALRIAWMVLPDTIVDVVVDAKRYADMHTESIGQLALADLITSHGYDRHVRSCRLRYRHRRDLLVSRLRSHSLHGIAAGLHALVSLPATGPTEHDVLRHAESYGLALGDLGSHWHTSTRRAGDRQSGQRPEGLIIGYGTPPASAYSAALDTLARVLRTVKRVS
jgi:GntR family transcriptional regulator/MocR family aminotransferase